ncbi:MAG: hypothetical protein ACRDKZ_08015 [Actinomycetota bacterium]
MRTKVLLCACALLSSLLVQGIPSGASGAAEPRAKRATGSFKLVGHDPLQNRGMNAALAVHGDYAYIGSRTDAKPGNLNGAGVLVVDVSNPSKPEVVHEIGPPTRRTRGKPRASCASGPSGTS